MNNEQFCVCWTEEDKQMLSSIEDELLVLIGAYTFNLECLNNSKEEIERLKKAIAFKHKQIDWLQSFFPKTNN